jgi:hypothetical protein
MKPASFTNRVLVTGAVGVSLVVASLSVYVIYSTAAALGGWQNWLQLKALGPLLQIVTAFLMLLGAAALDIAVWQRIISRRRSFQKALMPGFHSLTPRGKYAAWRPARQTVGRNAAFGTLRTRKKIGR